MINNISISKLNLRNRQLRKIPVEVINLKNLKKLDLRNNNLRSIPKEITKLTRLEVLDISYNNIQFLYAGMFKLKNLKILILSYNKLKSLPKQIEQLTKLKILILAGNELKSLPDEITKLSLLQELNISNNRFIDFPNEILYLTTLKSLWINGNNFQNFPSKEILYKLTKLKSLYCFGFPTVEGSVKNNDYLRLSKIRGNSLKLLQTTNNRRKKKHINKNMVQRPIVKKENMNSIFISYSRNDSKWLDRVKLHLKVLSYENQNFEVWDDTRIKSGKKWKEEITIALNKCRIAILLISTDFLASDFIRSDELPSILKNAEKKGTIILPLIIHPSRFIKDKYLSVFQAVNDPQKPLSKLSLPEQDEILVKLTNDVEDYLE